MENQHNLTDEMLALLEAQLRAFFENQALVDEELELPINWRIGLICAFSLNITLSIIGNIVVLVVLLFNQRPQSELNHFLINLALADLTMAIFCMPFTFSTIMYGYWIFSTGMCPTVIFMQQVSVMVSVYTLTAIGIDRYFAVLYPMKLRVTSNRSKILFGIIWLVSVLLATVQTAFSRAREVQYGRRLVVLCTEWWPYDSAAIIYEIFMISLTYIIPVSCLLFCYVRIGRHLWRRNIPGNADQQRDSSCIASKKRVIKMLILVVALFVLCYLPLHIFMLVTRLSPYMYGSTYHQDLMRKINSIVLWVAMSNSFMNPIIYSFMNDGFRADLKTMYSRCLRRAQGNRVRRSARRTRSLSSSVLTSTYSSRTKSSVIRGDG